MSYLGKCRCVLGLFVCLIWSGYAFAGETKKERATDETEQEYQQRLAREEAEEDSQGGDEISDGEIDIATLLGVDPDVQSPEPLLRPRDLSGFLPIVRGPIVSRPYVTMGSGSDAGFFAFGNTGGEAGQNRVAMERPSPKKEYAVDRFFALFDSYREDETFGEQAPHEVDEVARDAAVQALKKVFDAASEDEKKEISGILREVLEEDFYEGDGIQSREVCARLWVDLSDFMTLEDNERLGLAFLTQTSVEDMEISSYPIDMATNILKWDVTGRTPEGKSELFRDYIARFGYDFDDNREGLDELGFLEHFGIELQAEDFDLETLLTLLEKNSGSLFFHLRKADWAFKLVLSPEEIEELLVRIDGILRKLRVDPENPATPHRTKLLHYLLEAVYAQFVSPYMSQALSDAVRLNLPFLINGLLLDEHMKMNDFAQAYVALLQAGEVALEEIQSDLSTFIEKTRYDEGVTIFRGNDDIHAEALWIILQVLSLGKAETPEEILRLACDKRVSAANLIKMWPKFTRSKESSEAVLLRRLIEHALFEGDVKSLKEVGKLLQLSILVFLPGDQMLSALNETAKNEDTLEDILSRQGNTDLEEAFEGIFGQIPSVLSDHPRPNEGEYEPEPKRHCPGNEASGKASDSDDSNGRARKHFYKKDR